MIRRAFIRALSGAILTTLLGVKAWRPQDLEWLPVGEPKVESVDGYALVRILSKDRYPSGGSIEYMVIGTVAEP